MEITFYAYGHPNIKGTHKTTLEITKDNFLTPRGTCIVGIKSEIACSDLPETMKQEIKNSEAKIVIVLEVDGMRDEITAYGDERLRLTSRNSMVIRKSTYIDDRTLAVRADKAAKDINRKIIERLTDPNKRVTVTLRVEKPNIF
jgi:hypothetical protein